MRSLSRHEIGRLREKGYLLDGDNWMKVPGNDQAAGSLRVAKVCNVDTLVVVMIPEDILTGTESA